jgi:hypothetical protein
MATRKPAIPPSATRAFGISGFANAAGRSFRNELQEREAATSRILAPDDVQGGYSASRLLLTTLGGQLRAITSQDLATFRDSARKLGKKFKGGITAKEVIELSLKEDRDRANQEIKVALPVRAKGDTILFVTNAGPNYGAVRHNVVLKLTDLGAAVASPSPAAKLARMLVQGGVKYDCDCGRHRFWYRYIATIGRFNAGRDETGFPKIRNPRLKGVACKHVLRVMNRVISDTGVLKFVEGMIERARADLKRGAYNVKPGELNAALERQVRSVARQAGKIRTAAEKAVAASKKVQAQTRVISKVAKTVARADDRKAKQSAAQVEKHARTLFSLGLLTQTQLDTMLRAVRASK